MFYEVFKYILPQPDGCGRKSSITVFYYKAGRKCCNTEKNQKLKNTIYIRVFLNRFNN